MKRLALGPLEATSSPGTAGVSPACLGRRLLPMNQIRLDILLCLLYACGRDARGPGKRSSYYETLFTSRVVLSCCTQLRYNVYIVQIQGGDVYFAPAHVRDAASRAGSIYYAWHF